LGVAGAVTAKPPALGLNARTLMCWFMLKEWVTDDRPIMVILATSAACAVSTWKVVPWSTVTGALVITGRGPLNR
jgi:hypothetical protein